MLFAVPSSGQHPRKCSAWVTVICYPVTLAELHVSVSDMSVY